MTVQLFYWIFLALCTFYVTAKGGAPERVAILIAVAASVLSVAATSPDLGVRFRTVETGVLLVDVATFAAFLLLSLRADRFWPLWITGIHLVGVATHSARLASPDVIPIVYANTQALWSYPILLLIVIGTMRHRKRLRRFGADSSWTSSFVPFGRRRPPLGPTG